MSDLGFDSGKSLIEIKNQVDGIYQLDIPVPILKKLLTTISKEYELENPNQFLLYQDGSFQIKRFLFSNYEEELLERETEIDEVNKLYVEYLNSINVKYEEQPSLFDFIDQSRLHLSRYFAYKEDSEGDLQFVHQANFINSIKPNKKVYEILRRVYLGSIFSAYLEVDIGTITSTVELLLDTNFIIGLLDLNSEESTHTCRKILEICNRIGYKASVLPFTLEEVELLIERKANQLSNAFFQGYLDPESIYNAAKRRGLTKTQLQQIANNLKTILETEYNVNIVASDQKYRDLAKYQYPDVYEFYQKLRGTGGFSAHHDATAIAYVKEKRGRKPIKGTIQKANAWFVTNTHHSLAMPATNGFLPDIIKADEILNYLWLSNPNVTALINSSELSVLGLTQLVSNTISYSLPSSRVLKTLDDNFNKFGGTEITADDTVMIASMIASKKIPEPEELNTLANNNPDSFIQTVKRYAERGRLEEKVIQEKLIKVLNTFEDVVKLKREEKAEKESNLIESETNYEREIERLKFRNATLKSNFKITIVIITVSVITIFLWTFDLMLKADNYHIIKNYLYIKLIIQGLLITFPCAIFNKQYKTAWISGTIALILGLITLLKA